MTTNVISSEQGNEPLSFQETSFAFSSIGQIKAVWCCSPIDNEVGAGTFHTATTLRSLGPSAWRAAYVQPCRRPTDGRYGENPQPHAALLSVPGALEAFA